MAAGGHRADGGELPRGRRGRQRVRPPDRGGGARRRRRGGRAARPAAGAASPRKVADGTADMTTGPALTRDQAAAAVEVGIEVARDLVAAGNRAPAHRRHGHREHHRRGRADLRVHRRRPRRRDRPRHRHRRRHARPQDRRRAPGVGAAPPRSRPTRWGVLAAFGGLEHAALAGFVLGGAAARVPVLLDGVNAGAAALVAAALRAARRRRVPRGSPLGGARPSAGARPTSASTR